MRSYFIANGPVVLHVLDEGPLVTHSSFRLFLDADFDPASEAILAESEPYRRPGFRGQCNLLVFQPDRIVIEATPGDTGLVARSETHNPGRRVRLDGRPAPLLRANPEAAA